MDRLHLIFAPIFGFVLGCICGAMVQLFAIGYGALALMLIVGIGLLFGLDVVFNKIGLAALDAAGKRWGTGSVPQKASGKRSSRLIFAAAVLAGLAVVLLGVPVDRLFALIVG